RLAARGEIQLTRSGQADRLQLDRRLAWLHRQILADRADPTRGRYHQGAVHACRRGWGRPLPERLSRLRNNRAGRRHGGDLDPLFCGRQGGQPSRCLCQIGHSAFRSRDRFWLVLFPDETDLSDLAVLLWAARQFWARDPAADAAYKTGVLPARQQILRGDEQDEIAPAGDAENPRALPRRQGAPAARDHGDVQEGRRQPAGRLSADHHPDPGVLLALQSAVRHYRDAARAVLWLDP